MIARLKSYKPVTSFAMGSSPAQTVNGMAAHYGMAGQSWMPFSLVSTIKDHRTECNEQLHGRPLPG